MESFWKYNTQISERSALENNTHIHTVIIGAGMAGVLTAYLLKQCGIAPVMAPDMIRMEKFWIIRHKQIKI